MPGALLGPAIDPEALVSDIPQCSNQRRTQPVSLQLTLPILVSSGNRTAGVLVQHVGKLTFQNDASGFIPTWWVDSDCKPHSQTAL